MAFQDIFSNKKIKEVNKNRHKITIDNREKNSLVASFLVSKGLDIEFKQLPIADYLVNNVAIERKTISDLNSSIIDKRIFSQLKELKQYEKNILIIENQPDKSYKRILHENAIKGFFLSVALDFQTPMIFSNNEQDTADYIFLLSKKKENKSPSLRPSKVFLSKEQRLQYILEGFPSIGPATAKKLLKEFKSVKNVINASQEQLQEILGKNTSEFTSLINYLILYNNLD
jgi:ERCC4-type nuclease